MGLNETLGIAFPEASRNFVKGELPITDAIRQPFGFVHGGATIALLESVASLGTELNSDHAREIPFGVNVNVTHRKSGVDGTLHGEAVLDREEKSSKGYRKLFWNVRARDDAGDVVSEGSVLCLIVPKSAATPNPHVR